MNRSIVVAMLALSAVSCRRHEELTIWHTESDPATQRAFEDIGARLTKRNPQLTVHYQYIPWDQLSNRLTMGLRAGGDFTNLPDISHLEPYMAYSLYKEFPDALIDITDVVDSIQHANGPVADAVRDLQRFGGRYYGMAQHTGVSFIIYRADLLRRHNLPVPRTWAEFFRACQVLKRKGIPYPIAVPGSSPFFMEAILSEYLSTRGGAVYRADPSGRVPNLRSPEVKDALGIFAQMHSYVNPQYKSTSYLDQFRQLTDTSAAFVMFAGARAYKTFEQDARADTLRYATLPPPRFDNVNRPGFTSLDAEPWVIFHRLKGKEGDRQIQLAKEWLYEFYSPKGYVAFLRSVPIQLMPIFPRLQAEYSSDPAITKWNPWYRQARLMVDSNMVRPYFMQAALPNGTKELFRLHNSQILYDLIISAIEKGAVPSDSVLGVAENAMKRLQ